MHSKTVIGMSRIIIDSIPTEKSFPLRKGTLDGREDSATQSVKIPHKAKATIILTTNTFKTFTFVIDLSLLKYAIM